MRAYLTNVRGFNLSIGIDYRGIHGVAFRVLAQVAQKSSVIFKQRRKLLISKGRLDPSNFRQICLMARLVGRTKEQARTEVHACLESSITYWR
jgi:hypothetical protein